MAIASRTSKRPAKPSPASLRKRKPSSRARLCRSCNRCSPTPKRRHVEFADDDSTLFFRIGHRVLTSRKLTGQFPNYEAVMPRDNNKFVIVRSTDLFASIQRVAQFADERSGAIKMRIEQNELKVSSSSTEAGESEDTIETPYTFDAIVVGFNSVVPHRFPQGHRQRRRSPPRIQRRAVRRPGSPRRRLRRLQIPLHHHAHAHLTALPSGTESPRLRCTVGCVFRTTNKRSRPPAIFLDLYLPVIAFNPSECHHARSAPYGSERFSKPASSPPWARYCCLFPRRGP